MVDNPFESLQLSLVMGTDFDPNLLLDAIMEDPNSLESYSTFYRALLKSKLDPTELLTTAATLTLQVDSRYLMYVGLALRFGANPNAYVTGVFVINDVSTEIPVHLAKHLWDMTPRSIEESQKADKADVFNLVDHPLLDILAMLMLSGLDPRATVSTPELLLENGVDATAFMAERPDFGYSLYETFENDDEIGRGIANHLGYYETARGNLQLAYGLDPIRDEKLLAYAFHLDLSSILTLSNVYAEVDNYRKLIFFQDIKAFEILLPTLEQLGIIGREAQDKTIERLILNWTVEYYALEIMLLLLDGSLPINDELKDKTIELAKATCEPYPVQCQLLNRMIVEYVRHGYFFNPNQLAEVASYSIITHEAIQAPSLAAKSSTNSNVRSLPQLLKSVRTERIISPPKRLLIGDRELPSIGNETIDEFQQRRVSYNQPPIVRTSPSLATASLSPSLSANEIVMPSAPVCANENSLPRSIEDYSVVDKVTYSDGQFTWCFTSDIYEELLSTGVNPWLTNQDGSRGQLIPQEVMVEMAQKLDALKCNRLVSGDEDTLAQREVEELYRFAEEYGIPRERFYRLTSRDFQQLADTLSSPTSRVVIRQGSPILAVRDFARAIMPEARRSPERIGQFLAMFLV